jgi:AcrR family transcriptional regulator
MSRSKRDELVQKALEAFDRGGFNAVGMDLLAQETGVSKTSIYKHFRTKDDLILATLRLRDEQFRNRLVRRVEALAKTPKERLLAIFDALGEWFQEPGFRGCMFVKAASEFQDGADPIHAACVEHKRLILNYIRAVSVAAGARNPDKLARQLGLLSEGAIIMAQLSDPKTAAQDAREAAVVLVEEGTKRN